MISKKERQEVEKLVRSLYQDVLSVEIKEDSSDESSLLLNITRGRVMPTVRLDKKSNTIKSIRNKKGE